MSDATTLADLIAHLDAATGPDRELDEEIMALRAGVIREVQNGRSVYHVGTRWVGVGDVPPFTASVDAAVTLVPDGWMWTVCGGEHRGGQGVAFMAPNGGNSPADRWIDDTGGATPAIALCIAALKARSQP
jgi:hypothetical protein